MIFSHFPKNNKTKTSFMQKICLFAFGLFLCAILLESGLRLGGFIFLSFQEYRNVISARQKSVYRILCLGESTTANTWPHILEEILNQEDMNTRFTVIDKGVPGINTTMILLRLKNNLDKYNPDMVIAMMGINDGSHVLNQKDSIARKVPALLSSSRIYKLFKWVSSGAIFAQPERNNDCTHVDDSVQLSAMIEEDIHAGLKITDRKSDDKIEKIHKKAIRKHPENEKLYLGLGIFYESRYLYDKAELTHLKAIDMNPEGYIGYIALALLYEHSGSYDKAEETYKKVIEFNSKNPWAYYGLSSLYCRQGRYDEAEKVLGKGAEINPDIDGFYGGLALVYERQKKHSLAKKYFEKADRVRVENYSMETRSNYQKLQKILKERNIKLVCVQYPMRGIDSLREMFEDKDGIIFADNESMFKKALKASCYDDYFEDSFAGDFGHCTRKGYGLLASNIADTILKEYFYK